MWVIGRFHEMFHLAGDLYYLREKVLIYLDKTCNNNTTLQTSLVKVYNLVQLHALGITGSMVTGPYMHALYTNAGISNLDSV